MSSLNILTRLSTPAEDYSMGCAQSYMESKTGLGEAERSPQLWPLVPFYCCIVNVPQFPLSGHGPTHQAVLKPLLYVGSCWARDLAEEGFSFLRKCQHLQGQSQVLDEMEHRHGVQAGGWRRQPGLTGTITKICSRFSAWNGREGETSVRRVDVTVNSLTGGLLLPHHENMATAASPY